MAGVLLAVDVGNTNIKLGAFAGEELTATWRLETDAVRMPDEYAVLLDWLLQRRGLTFNAYVPKPIGAAQLCQVVAPYRPAVIG